MTWWARLALAGQRSGNLHEGTVWITIETVDGLEENDLVTAAMEDPAPETDATFEQIGRKTAGSSSRARARNTPEQIGGLHMHEARRINDHVVPGAAARSPR